MHPALVQIREAREGELQALSVEKYLDALCVYFWAATSILTSIITFTLYALLGYRLTADVVFTSLALFNVLIVPLNGFPWVSISLRCTMPMGPGLFESSLCGIYSSLTLQPVSLHSAHSLDVSIIECDASMVPPTCHSQPSAQNTGWSVEDRILFKVLCLRPGCHACSLTA